jgi:hypothetical protein
MGDYYGPISVGSPDDEDSDGIHRGAHPSGWLAGLVVLGHQLGLCGF